MQHSDQVNELFTALSKALGEIDSLPFNRTNPHFKSKYADLAITIEKSKPALMKHGLMLIQAVENEGDKYHVESMLTHSSGQWLKSKVELILTKKDMQGLGSATTYAKRYAAQSLLFVAGDEDDDGNAASAPPNSKNGSPPVKQRQSPAEIVMPFGSANGKKIGDIDTATLEKARDWLKSEIAKKPENLKQVSFIYAQVKAVLLDRNPPPPPEPSPTEQSDFNPETGEVFPPDDYQDHPPVENESQERRRRGKAQQQDPAKYLINVGHDLDGIEISQIGEGDLRALYAWTEKQMKTAPPPKGIANIMALNSNLKSFFKEVGLWPLNHAPGGDHAAR